MMHQLTSAVSSGTGSGSATLDPGRGGLAAPPGLAGRAAAFGASAAAATGSLGGGAFMCAFV